MFAKYYEILENICFSLQGIPFKILSINCQPRFHVKTPFGLVPGYKNIVLTKNVYHNLTLRTT